MNKNGLSEEGRLKVLFTAVVMPLLVMVLLFLAAGRWDYWQAWVYGMLNLVILVLMSTVLTPDKSLMEERLNPREGMKGWDKYYFAVTTPMFVIALSVAGLDARFGWTRDMPLWVYWGSVGVHIVGQAIFQWARYCNRYFSSVVRIQVDRGQTVCREGPYRYVRHPGYVGGFLYMLTTGLVLGSWWATIPQIMAVSMLVWRAGREDRTLLAELPGYPEYAQQTRWRMLPGVW